MTEVPVRYFDGDTLREAITRLRDDLDTQSREDPSFLSDRSLADALTMLLDRTESTSEQAK